MVIVVEMSRFSTHASAIRILVILIVSGLAVYGLGNMYAYGFYDRTIEGIHWYAVIFFLGMLLVYLARDKVNTLFALPIAATFYCLHEAIFNVFFLSYHMFLKPPSALPAWYYEMALIAVVTPVFLIVSWKFGDWLVRQGRWTIPYLASWVGFMVLTLVWMNYGFPVSANVYGIYATNTPSTMANIFEISTNILFAFAFYITFSFKRTIPKSALNVVPASKGPAY